MGTDIGQDTGWAMIGGLGSGLRCWAGIVAVIIKVMVTMIYEVDLCLGDKRGLFRLSLLGSPELNFFAIVRRV